MGPASIFHDRCPVDERPGSVQFRGHVCQFELYGLESNDRAVELRPLSGVTQSGIKRSLADPDGCRPNGHAKQFQCLYGNLEALAEPPQKVTPGDEAAVK